jgi:hypothetical protein
MKTKPLTKSESDWIKKLQTVLDECPSSRLGAYTTGDAALRIYDNRFESRINKIIDSGTSEFCMAVDDVGAAICTLNTPFPIHSTAG